MEDFLKFGRFKRKYVKIQRVHGYPSPPLPTPMILGWYHLGWHHIMIWTHDSIDLWWRPGFFILLCLQPHLYRKPTNFTAKTFFLVFTYFWTEKGWHHEIPPRVPPFLATPLIIIKLKRTTAKLYDLKIYLEYMSRRIYLESFHKTFANLI